MKLECVLLMYDMLLQNESLTRSTFCKERHITERTFYRYIGEISDFLKKHKPRYFIDVCYPSGVYVLKTEN